jgi:hypothetical protein
VFGDFEGYVDSRVFPDKSFAFVHYDTVEQAMHVRKTLHNCVLHNQTLRLGYGKSNHTRTRGGGGDMGGTPASGMGEIEFDPETGVPIRRAGAGGMGGVGGQLVTLPQGGSGQMLLVPAESAAGGFGGGGIQQPKYVTQKRNVVHVSLEQRLASFLSGSYHYANGPAPPLPPHEVVSLCNMVDGITERTAGELVSFLRDRMPTGSFHHAASVIARRLKEYHASDPHKRLVALYAVALVAHGAPDPKALVGTIGLVLAAVVPGQCSEGHAHANAVAKSFLTYLQGDEGDFHRTAIEALMETGKAKNDLGSLLSKLTGKK